MTTATATTVRTVVSVEQAAELNELFLTWLRRERPQATAVENTRSLRAANWQSLQASAFDTTKATLEAWLA